MRRLAASLLDPPPQGEVAASGVARRRRRGFAAILMRHGPTRPADAGHPPRWGGIKAVALLALLICAAPILALAITWARLPLLDLAPTAERSPIVLDRNGQLLRAFTMQDGRWRMPTTVADVDPRYIAMLLAFEDKRFRSHAGVDSMAIVRAASQSLRHGRIISGGSTLTMQVARLIEPRDERSLVAKLRQMARAIELERQFSKDEILSLYLSLAPFGGNIEGIRAASFAYFGKDARRLSHAEAATLVALPQAPELRRPDRFPERAARGRNRVLAVAMQSGVIPEGERQHALGEMMPTARKPFPMLAAHAAEAAVRERPGERIHRLTIDAGWQAMLEGLAKERAEQLGPKLSASILVVEQATGAIRASVGGAGYFADERAGAMDLTQALRSPGSALKPFIYAMAFEEGIAHPSTVLEDRPHRYGLYAPENFDQTFQGTVTARKALQMSLNVPTVDLLSALGPQRFVSRMRSVGAGLAMPPEGAPGLAIGLGGVGITLRDLTRLYAGLSRGGEATPLQIRLDSPVSEERFSRFVDPVPAWYVADTLLGAPPPANAQGGRIAYKTGTSYGYRDAWSVGFDRKHTIGVWVGRPDNAAVPGLVGRLVAAPILFDAFSRVGVEPGVGPRPADAIVAGTHDLPLPLRHMRKDLPKTALAIASASLKLAFPPDGAKIEMPLDSAARDNSLALKITGGKPPFTAYVNGRPVAASATRRTLHVTPDGAGFTRISIVDGAGETDSVTVRLQ
jgi:penicillin-binding protein 1C